MPVLIRGAHTGLASALLALAGFCATLTVVLLGHLGAHGYLDSLEVEFRANRLYVIAGAVTGLVLGALGAWIGHRHRRYAWPVVGALMV
jgi:hypothetical protein